MPRRLLFTLAVVLLLLLQACAGTRQRLAVSTAFASHHLCSETFVSGLDPQQVFAERIAPMAGVMSHLLNYEIDRKQGRATVDLAGSHTTTAQYREGLGCVVLHGEPPAASTLAPRAPTPEASPLVEAPTPALRAVLDRAFTEREAPPFERTKAVVIVKDGRVLAERYAPGHPTDTPWLGFSMAKSVLHALVGVLVRQGKLQPDAPAPIAEWRSPGDPRGAITLNHLLRQTSGLDVLQDNSGTDPSARMSFLERDMAGFAAQAGLRHSPGTRWDYSEANHVLIGRIVRDAVGGRAEDVATFARRELFTPLGMHSASLEFDATGTPLPNYVFASARDWARFGALYLNDGQVGDQRVLPAGWAAHAATPTLGTGYGAGFWVNTADGLIDRQGWGVPWGMPGVPRDAFFARGFMGQYVVVVPSERLVVVRLAVGQYQGDNVRGMARLVAEALAALHGR